MSVQRLIRLAMLVIIMTFVSAAASANAASLDAMVPNATSGLANADSGEIQALDVSSAEHAEAERKIADSIRALQGREAAGVSPLYWEGYIWLTSHTNMGTYSYGVGPSIGVDSYATDSDDWGYYVMVTVLYDIQTDSIINSYWSPYYVDGYQSSHANVLTGGLQTVSGRYQIWEVLWDDLVETTEDMEYFNVNFVPDKVYSSIDGMRITGQALTFAGHASDSLGHGIDAYQWRSNIDGVIGYGASGAATLSPGTHTIYFKSHCAGGVWSPEVAMTVTSTYIPDRVYASIDGLGASGLTLLYAGHASDSKGHAIDAYQWRSSIDGVIGYGASGSATLSAGRHSIYFKAHCAGGVWSAESRIDITVTRPDVVASYIDSISPASGMVSHKVSFTGRAVDTYGHSMTAYQWRSDRDGTLSTARTFSTSSLSQGTHTIYFKSKCSNNTWSPEVSRTLTVVPMDHTHPSLVSVAGTTRIATAIAASKLAYPGGASHVVVATASNWPDALGGSALAGALDAPILLTFATSLPTDVVSEIDRLGASEVIVLGGVGAISDNVKGAIDSLPGVTVERIAGGTRYETAGQIASRTISVLDSGSGYDGTAFLATGGNFPDALGASPLAAAQGWPIYLIDPNGGDNAELASQLVGAGVTEALILGGTGAVSTPVETKMVEALASVDRLAGSSRFITAVNVANYGVDYCGLTYNRFAIATGANFPDALAGGVLQAKSNSVLLLTPSAALDPYVGTALGANKASITEYRVLGGSNAVSAGAREQILAAIHP